MFRNREMRMQIVKKDKNENTPTSQPGPSFVYKAAVVGRHVERVVKWVGLGVLAYVAADTVRQVAIAQASNPKN